MSGGTAVLGVVRQRVVAESVTYLVAVALAALVSALFILAMHGNVVIAFRTMLASTRWAA